MREYLQMYVSGEMTAIALIRYLSGEYAKNNPQYPNQTLAVINMVSRIEEGALKVETFKLSYGLK